MNLTKQSVYVKHWGDEDFFANLNIIKNLRKQYANYPYLYEYDEVEEDEYIRAYLQAGNELDAFVCLIDSKVVGISIGCPLINTIPICKGLDNLSINTDKTYYFGDIIILKEAWGQGIADKLYQSHISDVIEKGYQNIIALLVERDEDDPRKPENFRPSNLWVKHGFKPSSEIKEYTWNTQSYSDKPPSRQTHKLRVYEKVL